SDLVTAIEAAKYEAFVRQSAFGSRWRVGRDFTPSVIDLVTPWQLNQVFREKWLLVGRRDEFIDENVIDESSAGGPGIAEVVRLNWSRARRQNLHTAVARMAVQVDQNVHLILGNSLGRLQKGRLSQIRKMVERTCDPVPDRTLIVTADRVSEYAKT